MNDYEEDDNDFELGKNISLPDEEDLGLGEHSPLSPKQSSKRHSEMIVTTGNGQLDYSKVLHHLPAAGGA
jgi:hypothetical protein